MNLAAKQAKLRDADRRAIAEAKRILQEQFPVERVVLYGSKARGTDDPESDIDLLVLTTRQLDWRERHAITDALFAVEAAHDVVIDTLIVPTKQWDDGPYVALAIHDEIDATGMTV
jgi:predicted nucleotidyltransferase